MEQTWKDWDTFSTKLITYLYFGIHFVPFEQCPLLAVLANFECWASYDFVNLARWVVYVWFLFLQIDNW